MKTRLFVAVLVVAALAASTAFTIRRISGSDRHRAYLAASGWPEQGQAAFAVGSGGDVVGPGQHAVPIASVAKVMTAHLVLKLRRLQPGEDGPTITVTRRDVRDTARRHDRDESLVPVRAGERLTERQALLALLLPSANNMAIMLARFAAGSVAAFVQRMNAEARLLGMGETHYTDPSGFDPGTVSTAHDQLRLARVVAGDAVFGELVAQRSARIPVAGVVHSTDRLLGHDGFVGTKTGSDDAAGGCFMFRTRRVLDGRRVDVVGVVLGQPGRDLVAAGLSAARQLADRIAPEVAA